MTGGAGNALLSDIQARAERRRTRTREAWWQDLVRQAWDKAQGAEPAVARQWLERAHRMLPKDGLVLSALATATLRDGDGAQAAKYFQQLASVHAMPEGWAGLALCCHLGRDTAGAVAALIEALQSTAPSTSLAELADAITGTAGLPGWCGLSSSGVLMTGLRRPELVLLDGAPARLRWRRNQAAIGKTSPGEVGVQSGGRHWIGSPLPASQLMRLEGFAEPTPGGLRGWAWYPADPNRDPAILVQSAKLTLTEPDECAQHLRPLARPRRFIWLGQPGLVSVTDDCGRHLMGSPVTVGLEQSVAAAMLTGHPAPAPGPVLADIRGAFPRTQSARRNAAIVVPVHRGLLFTLACLDSVMETVPRGTRIVVVEDASPEPALVTALQQLQAQGRIELVRLPQNLGFPGAANAGLRACAGQDIVLLNSDTLLPPGWLGRLRDAAYAAPNTGTATPLSNDATILSYPNRNGGNPVPDGAGCAALDRLARLANGKQVVEIPTGVGFCLYIRRDCLDHTGPLREDVFAQGYGEENDFCLRARALGWRHVAATGVFVAHVGGQSFGPARAHLIRRNLAALNRLHPGYDALIAQHVAADPLAPHRRRMDERRWKAQPTKTAAVLITHGGGGGVDVVIGHRRRALAGAGHRPIVLRPAKGGCRVDDGAYPNLRYAVPEELPALAALLKHDKPTHIELHHRLGQAPEVMGLAPLLNVPWDVYVHDFAWFCQRIALTGPERRYCGEPDIQGCEDCVADLGTLFEEVITMPALVARSTADLLRARRVIAPSQDTAQRIGRHFPGLTPAVEPWEDDRAWPALRQPTAIRRVCVIGAIGPEKGFDVLLGCVRDARSRALGLAFTVAGYTADDERLLDAGPVWITGEYDEQDAAALIAEQRADIAFIPSIWPETWCFALSRAWEAGLPAVAFDLGAPAERIRATGRGWTLPLGLRPAAINDALLTLASGR